MKSETLLNINTNIHSINKSIMSIIEGSPSLKNSNQLRSGHPRRAKRALGSEENSRCMLAIDSEMAGRIGLKLGGMVEGMCENVLAKEFF